MRELVYQKISEKDLLRIYSTDNIEEAVNSFMACGHRLVSVSYVGGCKVSGQHIYHFIDEYLDGGLVW